MEATVQRRRGRPRDPAVGEAILGATRELLVDVGYTALTIEGVAERAGVTKPTIYRRWPTKGALVSEAVFGKTKAMPMPNTGEIASDLRIIAGWGADEFMAPEARAALPGMLADIQAGGDVRAALQERVLAPEYARVRQVLERAQRRGEIRKDVDLELLMDVFVGTVFGRAVLLDHPIDDKFVERIVDLALRGAVASDSEEKRGRSRT